MSAGSSAGAHAPAGMLITVNDQPRTINEATTLAAIVADLGLAGRKGVAVAVNGSVVPRGDWSSHALAHRDKVLVIRATQGG
jgi:sulfur carrier protein